MEPYIVASIIQESMVLVTMQRAKYKSCDTVCHSFFWRYDVNHVTCWTMVCVSIRHHELFTLLDQELISYRCSSCCGSFSTCSFLLSGRPLQKSLKLSGFKSDLSSGWNLARMFFKYTQLRIDWRSRISDVTSYVQDGGHDVISRRKMLPSGECMHEGVPTHM